MSHLSDFMPKSIQIREETPNGVNVAVCDHVITEEEGYTRVDYTIKRKLSWAEFDPVTAEKIVTYKTQEPGTHFTKYFDQGTGRLLGDRQPPKKLTRTPALTPQNKMTDIFRANNDDHSSTDEDNDDDDDSSTAQESSDQESTEEEIVQSPIIRKPNTNLTKIIERPRITTPPLIQTKAPAPPVAEHKVKVREAINLAKIPGFQQVSTPEATKTIVSRKGQAPKVPDDSLFRTVNSSDLFKSIKVNPSTSSDRTEDPLMVTANSVDLFKSIDMTSPMPPLITQEVTTPNDALMKSGNSLDLVFKTITLTSTSFTPPVDKDPSISSSDVNTAILPSDAIKVEAKEEEAEEVEEEVEPHIKLFGDIVAAFTALSLFVGASSLIANRIFYNLPMTAILPRLAASGFLFSTLLPLALFVGLNDTGDDITKNALKSLRNALTSTVDLADILVDRLWTTYLISVHNNNNNNNSISIYQKDHVVDSGNLMSSDSSSDSDSDSSTDQRSTIKKGQTVSQSQINPQQKLPNQVKRTAIFFATIILLIFMLTELTLAVSIPITILTVIISQAFKGPLSFIFGAISGALLTPALQLTAEDLEATNFLLIFGVCVFAGILNNLGGSPLIFTVGTVFSGALCSLFGYSMMSILMIFLSLIEKLKERLSRLAAILILMFLIGWIIVKDPMIFLHGVISGVTSCTIGIGSVKRFTACIMFNIFLLNVSSSPWVLILGCCFGASGTAIVRATGGLKISKKNWQNFGLRIWNFVLNGNSDPIWNEIEKEVIDKLPTRMDKQNPFEFE